jgi:hypothetical protein
MHVHRARAIDESSALLDRLPQASRRDPQSSTGVLHKRFMRGSIGAHHNRQPRHPFAPDQANLDTPIAMAVRDDRQESTLGEVD